MPVQGKVTLEGCRILFRNFAGSAGRFNAEGKRNFNVTLTPELAERMINDGWNVRELPPREEGEESLFILKVNINYSGRKPPRVVLITSRGKTNLGEADLSLLDWADITEADLIINPYNYEVQGKEGVTAYLDSLYATIREDELELKYLDVPDTAQSALMEPEGGPEPEE
jgi:hypothetical protein